MFQKYPKETSPHRAVAVISIIFILLSCIAVTGCLGDLGIPGIGLRGSSHQAENDGKLSAYFLDVGQGDSSLIILWQ